VPLSESSSAPAIPQPNLSVPLRSARPRVPPSPQQQTHQREPSEEVPQQQNRLFYQSRRNSSERGSGLRVKRRKTEVHDFGRARSTGCVRCCVFGIAACSGGPGQREAIPRGRSRRRTALGLGVTGRRPRL